MILRYHFLISLKEFLKKCKSVVELKVLFQIIAKYNNLRCGKILDKNSHSLRIGLPYNINDNLEKIWFEFEQKAHGVLSATAGFSRETAQKNRNRWLDRQVYWRAVPGAEGLALVHHRERSLSVL